MGHTPAEQQMALHRIEISCAQVQARFQRGWTIEHGSDVEALGAALVGAPVDITQTLDAALVAIGECMVQIDAGLAQGQFPSVVLATLTRTVLLGSGKVLHVLGYEDRETQAKNAPDVAKQEAKSLNIFLKHVGPWATRKDIEQEIRELDTGHPRTDYLTEVPGEGAMVARMAESVAQVLLRERPELVAADDPAAIKEHLNWVFQTYSGMAHSFAWPRLVHSAWARTQITAGVPRTRIARELGVDRSTLYRSLVPTPRGDSQKGPLH